jgi:ESX secretion-associated protein EspG
MVVPRTVELSLRTFLSASALVGEREPHPIFAGGLRFVPPSSKSAVDRQAFDELGGLGLTRGKHLSEPLVDTLEILDHPQVRLHAYVRTGDEQYGVLVAGLGRDGVVAVCRGDRVRLHPMPRGARHADLLVRELSAYPSAHFTPFSFAQHDDRSEEARLLRSLFERRHYGIGELHAPNVLPVTYLDIDDGRIGFALTGQANNRYIKVFPGAQLAGHLEMEQGGFTTDYP